MKLEELLLKSLWRKCQKKIRRKPRRRGKEVQQLFCTDLCSVQQLKMQAKRGTSTAYFGASFNLALKQQAKKLLSLMLKLKSKPKLKL